MAKKSREPSVRGGQAASPIASRFVDADVIARALVGLPEEGDPQLTSEELQDPAGLLLASQYAEFVRSSGGASDSEALDEVRRQLAALTQRVACIEGQLTLKPR